MEPWADDIFSLNELAEQVNVEPRTIRSYIEKGLLPGAEARGPKSFYTKEHLDRLRVIQILRQAGRDATLEEIRLLLQQLSAEQLEGIAEGYIQVGGLVRAPDFEPAPNVKPATDTAVDYLQRLKSEGGRSRSASAKNLNRPGASREARRAPVSELVDALQRLAGTRISTPAARGQDWYRIEITPDVELHIRGEFGDEQKLQFRRVADLLRNLLTRKGSPTDSS